MTARERITCHCFADYAAMASEELATTPAGERNFLDSGATIPIEPTEHVIACLVGGQVTTTVASNRPDTSPDHSLQFLSRIVCDPGRTARN